MSVRTDLLVIGAGPYAYSAAAFARDNGIDTRVVGHPMAFWREHMPADMFLRSGPDWHLDAGGEHTFAAYFEDRGLRPEEFDPIPIGVFLDYTEWFRRSQGLRRRRAPGHRACPRRTAASWRRWTTARRSPPTTSSPRRASGTSSTCRPGTPTCRRPGAAHTSELVSFDRFAGARVVIIGGRQSAYEWAALLCDHGAEHVDVVHRHSTSRTSPRSAGPSSTRTSTRRSRTGAGGAGSRPSGSRRSRGSSGRSAGSPSSPGSYRGSPRTS